MSKRAMMPLTDLANDFVDWLRSWPAAPYTAETPIGDLARRVA